MFFWFSLIIFTVDNIFFRRQILDEDNREVKIIQELLLEDGELHGAGRQRQFRWKNIGIYLQLN